MEHNTNSLLHTSSFYNKATFSETWLPCASVSDFRWKFAPDTRSSLANFGSYGGGNKIRNTPRAAAARLFTFDIRTNTSRTSDSFNSISPPCFCFYHAEHIRLLYGAVEEFATFALLNTVLAQSIYAPLPTTRRAREITQVRYKIEPVLSFRGLYMARRVNRRRMMYILRARGVSRTLFYPAKLTRTGTVKSQKC